MPRLHPAPFTSLIIIGHDNNERGDLLQLEIDRLQKLT